jgi:hypothetical protein
MAPSQTFATNRAPSQALAPSRRASAYFSVREFRPDGPYSHLLPKEINS